MNVTNLTDPQRFEALQISKISQFPATLMEARKVIVCALPAAGVKPQLKPEQPQQEAVNTAPPQRGQSSRGNDVDEITRAEFRSYRLIRIEEPEEDIDPDYLHYLRAIGSYDSAPPQQGRSSRGNGRR
ncbi:hypothetical protein YC2023_117139 [Brassica napus]